MQENTLNQKTVTINDGSIPATPKIHQFAKEIQKFGTRFPVPLGLPDQVCEQSITNLNKILADTITLQDLYKKCHWQTSGVTFYQLHLLFEKHYKEQAELVDELAERIQILGGISVAMGKDVSDMTEIMNPPKGREEVPVQLSRLLDGHEILLRTSRATAKQAAENGDDGTNDLIVSNVIRTNEMQAWFLAEHLVSLSAVEAEEKNISSQQ